KVEDAPVKAKEDANDNNAEHRHDDGEYEEFEFVDSVEEKLVPDDEAKLFDVKYALNQAF
ncbi:hypothetical protein AAVH_23305, partial [Aphelenchoides avenae]